MSAIKRQNHEDWLRGFQVVRATPEQVDLVAPLFDQYRVFYGQSSDLDAVRSFVCERLIRRDSVLFLAFRAEARSQLALGFAHLYPSFSSISMKRLWVLNDLFVEPATRGRGIARKLMEAAKGLATETASRGIVLETGINNKVAQALYEDLGYRRDDEFFRYQLSL